MAWPTTDPKSRVFRAFIADVLGRSATAAFDLDAPSTAGSGLKAALYNGNTTPDANATAANSTYGAGTWITGATTGSNEVFETGQWEKGGMPIAVASGLNAGTNDVVFLPATANTASGTAADLADVRGALVYDLAAANRGVCYNSFGGNANAVTNGTFTIVWSTLGILRFTLSAT